MKLTRRTLIASAPALLSVNANPTSRRKRWVAHALAGARGKNFIGHVQTEAA